VPKIKRYWLCWFEIGLFLTTAYDLAGKALAQTDPVHRQKDDLRINGEIYFNIPTDIQTNSTYPCQMRL
jgi:hypothetical protein